MLVGLYALFMHVYVTKAKKKIDKKRIASWHMQVTL